MWLIYGIKGRNLVRFQHINGLYQIKTSVIST